MATFMAYLPMLVTVLEMICVAVILVPTVWGVGKKYLPGLPSVVARKHDCRPDVSDALRTIHDAIPAGDNEYRKALLVLAPLGVLSLEKTA